MNSNFSRPRRGFLALGASWGLAGCGGGGDAGGSDPLPAAPAIQGFDTVAGSPLVGERLRLRPLFSGGAGRIEPEIGAVVSGAEVQTPVLDGPRRYTLVVEAAGRPTARRELLLPVRYRERYRPLALPFALQYHAAVLAADGGVLVIGGSRGEPSLSNAIDRFDPASGRFERLGQMRTGRALHSATRLASGQILVLGGLISLEIGGVAELIDERSGAVLDAGRPRQPRARHAALALADGRVLVAGGLGRDTLELWDPQQRQFRLLAARMRHVREFPSLTQLADGRVLIVGGYHDGPVNVTAELFDPATESLAPVATALDERRQLHEAHRMADGSVLILGGELIAPEGIRPLASVLRYEPLAGTLAGVQGLEQARTLVRSVRTAGDEIRLFGGQTQADAVAASACLYRPGQGATALPAMPVPRAWHSVTRLADGRILILGGDDAAGAPVAGGLLFD